MKQNLKKMLQKRKFCIFVICLIAASCAYSSFIRYSYHESIDTIVKEANSVIKEVLDLDLEARLAETNMNVRSQKSPADTTSAITIETDDGIKHIAKNSSVNELDNARRNKNALQWVLMKKNPINVAKLDTMFHRKLHEKSGLDIPTAVQYTDNTMKKTYYSNVDIPSYKNYTALGTIHAGINNEITIQAFVRISPFAFIRKSIFPVSVVSILWTGLIIIAIYYYFRKPKEKIVKELVTDPSLRTEIHVLDNLCLHVDMNCFVYNEKTIEMTFYITRFLKFLFDMPNYYATYDEIKAGVFKDEIVDGKGRLEQFAKYVRDKIQPEIPCFKLVTVRGKGYKIEIGPF